MAPGSSFQLHLGGAPRASKLERELADPWKEAGKDRVVIYTPDVRERARGRRCGSLRRRGARG